MTIFFEKIILDDDIVNDTVNDTVAGSQIAIEIFVRKIPTPISPYTLQSAFPAIRRSWRARWRGA